MAKISEFQMTDAKSWSGITLKNHLGSLFASQPQRASNLMTRIHQKNFGLDLDTYLSKFGKLVLPTDDDFFWELIGAQKRNIPLVEARISGTAITAADQPGVGFSEIELVFPEKWFTDVHTIVGHKNEKYQLRIVKDPTPEGTNWVYTCQLMTGSSTKFMPYDELTASKRFSREWSAVEDTLSKKGGGINFTSPFTMRNSFSTIRMQHTTAGNMINRPIGTMWKHPENGKTFMTWIQYEDYVFDHQFRLEKNRLLMFATSNRDNDNGKYYNYGKSGFVIRQGAGIRQQMESANTSYYGTFTIEYLLNYLMELSEGKLDLDTREFNGRTGERGAVQFHQSLEDHSQLFQPLFNQDRMFKISDPMAGGRLGLGYGGQFLRYLGPQGIVYSVSVDSLYSDRERNKIYHPSGGVAEAYRYDLMDIGTSEGEPNIMRVDVEGQSDIMGYEPGLRDPFSPTGGRNHIMSHATDGYTVHRMTTCGTKVHDPSRTASLIPNILE